MDSLARSARDRFGSVSHGAVLSHGNEVMDRPSPSVRPYCAYQINGNRCLTLDQSKGLTVVS